MPFVIRKGFMHLSYTIRKEDESDFSEEELFAFDMKLIEMCESMGLQIFGHLSPFIVDVTPDDDDWMEKMRAETERYLEDL